MDSLVYEFHKANIWTPEEIHETMVMSPLMRDFPLVLPQGAQETLVRVVMDDRFQQERRGMWGRMMA